jgi:anti-sigma factor RsiW
MRAFVRLREILTTHEESARKVAQHDRQITALFEHVKTLLEPPPPPKKRPIGFMHPKD